MEYIAVYIYLWPAGHITHGVVPPALKYPSLHFAGVSFGSRHVYPAGQISHLMDLVSFANVPFSQRTGKCILAFGQINPSLQSSHSMAPDDEYSPG